MFHVQRRPVTKLLKSCVVNLKLPPFHSSWVRRAPLWTGHSSPVTDPGPESLRGYGLLNKLNPINEHVVDFGNLNFDFSQLSPQDMPDISNKLSNKNEFILAKMCSQLSNFVKTATDKGYVSLILGGDHSIAVGSVIGTCNAERFKDNDVSLVSLYDGFCYN